MIIGYKILAISLKETIADFGRGVGTISAIRNGRSHAAALAAHLDAVLANQNGIGRPRA